MQSLSAERAEDRALEEDLYSEESCARAVPFRMAIRKPTEEAEAALPPQHQHPPPSRWTRRRRTGRGRSGAVRLKEAKGDG